jgi:hypothetical protein
VVRPSEGLLRAWRDSFLEAYMSDDFTLFYKIEPRYRIFIHQAILSGTVLSRLGMKKIMQLPAKYNYPLHLFRQDITEGKPKTLDELTTFRFESTYREPGWQNWIPASDDLKSWIISQINEIRL